MHIKFENLYQRYVDGTCTKEERAALLSIIAANPNDPQLAGLLDGTWNKIDTAELQPLDDPEGMLNNILGQQSKPMVKKIGWYPYAVAASIVMVLSVAIYLYTSRTPAVIPSTPTVVNIPPGTNKATLTLADGKVITLDSTAEGEIANQAGITIRKTQDGQLVYDITKDQKKQNQGSLAYNTIVTPRGGQYQVNLPDGTKIWLNAASSLKYPAVFNGKQRRVELTGEAYFEVAKDKAHPFIVATDKQEVQVLGTHFNVNSYADESATKTTLLEGSVKVSSKGAEKFLLPGQQSALRGKDLNVYQVDTEEAIAWKNGDFQFNEADLSSIMRQLSRWYNVDVSFEKKPTAELFHFTASRNISLADMQKIFEINGINFKIEGRTLIVKL
ncbi:transmembrane sensor [Pedobacter africanus]|uniref:Ferric-dicitrate binding protein FerR (Iron transport regulator) n=1 Tax=Pedobacter africanus TaxID=151894 RepID=A0ACC6KYL8_9SPHI|nr:FecR domain-containing protein [Pedobacter africanus]MDR6784316.1 ferric-dicitrate binding protein FerR (iron transport regulator) [Pedobacter africanus]